MLYVVRGSSMEPSMFDGDVLLSEESDIVATLSVSTEGRIDVEWQVKRVVGLPDEMVSFECGLLFINGTHRPEPYLAGLPADLGTRSRSWLVDSDEFIVLGDNRAHSTDSREFGPVPTCNGS